MSGGPSAHKKLVRMVARAFYAGPCPPREAEEHAISSGKWEKMDTTGLGVVILDALTQKAWVEENTLAEELQIDRQLLRRALNHFELEHIVRREHKKEGKRAQHRDVVVLATKDKQNGEEQPAAKAKLHSYCAIDYPQFLDRLNLCLYNMRQRLKSEDKDSDMRYACPHCGREFTSIDVPGLMALLKEMGEHLESGQLLCDECLLPLQELFYDGQTGNTEDRKKRREERRELLHKMEKELKPITEKLDEINGQQITPPDYGKLTDWAQNRAAEAKRAQAGGQGGAGANQVEIEVLGSPLKGTRAPPQPMQQQEKKQLPPWMLAKGLQTSTLAQPSTEAGSKMGLPYAATALTDRDGASLVADGDVQFKRVLDEVKRRYAYDKAMKASKKQQEAAGIKREVVDGQETGSPSKRLKVDDEGDGGVEQQDLEDETVWEDVKPVEQDNSDKDDDIEWVDAGVP
ncbi:unnamed protein product [Ostreobium quekettii]|uniref:HTH TFE/IIEalpha-type domain-containing protein n=1 Tax=Ostreobium quekettii TaxID=121088 RepID=A0A8S1J1T7_9CHLO|nr:unnamed protein product [Ostreobium quekettii]|eukprot:evm.model.scf_954.2 EVM.evm.TU.scf_954.2   scf_954:28468-38584(-)